MNKKFTLSLFFLLSILKLKAQDEITYAHMRSYGLHLATYFDSRYPAIMFKPEVDLRFANGLFQFKGHLGIQITPIEKNENVIDNRYTFLLGDNIDRAYQSYEFQVGVNFWGRLNRNAMLSYSKSVGGWNILTIEPGSRALQLGAHLGKGGFVSKTRGDDALFDIKDKNGQIFDLKNNNLPNGVQKYQVYTNTITDYAFVGAHLFRAKKPDRTSEKVRGGQNTSFSADLILPTRVWVGNVYSQADEKYTLSPKQGQNWKQLGYRVVIERTFTSSVFLHQKLEIGSMTNFTISENKSQSFYFSIGIGLSILPKTGYIDIKEIGE